MEKVIRDFDSKEDIEFYLIDLFKTITDSAIDKNKKAFVALSGGNTPLFFYEKLFSKSDIDWENIHIFFVDERMVSNEDEKSNIYHINKLIQKSKNIKDENIYYINKDIDVDDAALEYELEIKSDIHQERPSFDFVLLGLGTDGHTASLFDTKTLGSDKLIITSKKETEEFERVSFSYKLLNLCKNVVFLTMSEGKAAIVKKVLLDKDMSYPATHIKAKEKIYFVMDKQAGKFLDL